ncbi:MAG: hypothetical protein E7253_06090 [Lachnospiraceae bacterium]|nr:hypothetical protein [Lachnospiraceae bacterium]
MLKKTIRKIRTISSPEGKTKRYRWVLCIIAIVALITSCFCLGLMGLYFSTGLHKLDLFAFYLQQPKLVLLNTVPYILLGLFGWIFFNRAWAGFLTASTVCIVYSFTNYWKLVSRDDPIFAEDLSLLKEAVKMSDEYITITWQMYLALGLVIFGTIILAILIKGRFERKSLRLVLISILILSTLWMYNNIYISPTIYDSFSAWQKLNPWFENSKYISRGGIYPFIYSIQRAVPQPPEGYEEEEAKKLLDAEEYDFIPEEKQVNLMLVMYEAFSDLTNYTNNITEADPYEYFHKLQEESLCGELVTNIFAGGTIDTERSVLTGFSKLSSFRKSSWSYARYFGEMGYILEGSHAGYKAFYNRHNINRNLGIDNYRFIENYYNEIVDGIPMDDDFLPEISRLFEEAIDSGKKVFSFNVTYQNHGPYAATMSSTSKEYVPQGDLKTEDYAIVNNYLTGVENTAGHMYQMAERFRNHEEPVILVFFGDHKPWLGESSTTYTALGIDIFEETEESFYNHYNTEYLIWANNAAKKVLENDFVGQGPTISPCYLMNVLFNQCGWQGPSLMKISNKLMENLPVVTNNDRYLQNGKLVTSEEVTPENNALFDNLKKAQFYLANDYYKNQE